MLLEVFTLSPTKGSVIDLRDEQPEKAEDPIEVTLFGTVISVSAEQPENANDPMDVTALGMLISVNLLQFWNA